MATTSPFDDLLKEFDDDALGPRRPPEDPLRGENLQKLLALSKKLEGIAKTLDPSDAKHPLNGQSVPEEARVRLKTLVGELMRIQEALHDVEKGLLEAQEVETAKDAPSGEPLFEDRGDPPFSRERRVDRRDRAPLIDREEEASAEPQDEQPLPASKKTSPTDTSHPPSLREVEPFPTNAQEIPAAAPLPTTPPAEASVPVPPPPPAVTPDHLHLEQEKQAFEAYKASWERVFAADPSQRDAHPEVQQYYDQMDAYFKEKMAYIHAKNQQP